MRKLLPVFLFFIVSSCNQEQKVPNGIIEKPRMQELLWDMIRADAFITSFAGKGDTAFNQFKESVMLYRQVFDIHKTSKDEFKKSLEWYQRHPHIMRILLDTLQLRQRRIMEERSKPSSTFRPDSLNIQ